MAPLGAATPPVALGVAAAVEAGTAAGAGAGLAEALGAVGAFGVLAAGAFAAAADTGLFCATRVGVADGDVESVAEGDVVILATGCDGFTAWLATIADAPGAAAFCAVTIPTAASPTAANAATIMTTARIVSSATKSASLDAKRRRNLRVSQRRGEFAA
jgi:hypothetical protein